MLKQIAALLRRKPEAPVVIEEQQVYPLKRKPAVKKATTRSVAKVEQKTAVKKSTKKK